MVTQTVRSRVNTSGYSGRPLRVAVTTVAVTGFSLFGYDQGLMSGLITGSQFNQEFPPTSGEDTHATVIQGAVTACYEIGCFFGALFALFSGDKLGRRPLVILGASIIIVGTVISVAAFGPHWGLGQFVVGRVITGIGNGMNTATIPVWQSEMSRAENRGRLVNLEGSIIAVGTFVAYWIDFGMSYVDNSSQWRFPVAMQIVFAVFLLGGMIGMPESPRWLMARGRYDEAVHILAQLKGTTSSDPEIEKQGKSLFEQVSRQTKEQIGVKELFSRDKHQYLFRMFLGSSTQFFQQFTGCNAAIYYSTVLFKRTIGLSDRLSLVLGGVFATIYALSTIPSFFLIDRIGRRKLFLIGSIGQGCSFIITFGCLVKDTTQNAKGAAVGLFLFIVFFAFTILPLPWIYPPEINPMKSRTVATSVSTCTNWLCNFAVVMFTPVFIGNARWGCYLFFAIINFLFAPLIFFCYPETAGRTLEEVDIIFAKAFVEKRPAWRVADTMPKLDHEAIERETIALGLYEDLDQEEKRDQYEKDSDSNESSSENAGSPSGPAPDAAAAV